MERRKPYEVEWVDSRGFNVDRIMLTESEAQKIPKKFEGEGKTVTSIKLVGKF